MDYFGERCAACGGLFVQGDDIVVCPECGSPHHRECYNKEKKCANEALHGEGGKWQREKPLKSINSRLIVCPVCHFPNPADQERCSHCGGYLNEDKNTGDDTSADGYADEVGIGISRPYLGFNPDEDLGGATIREVSNFVDTNTIYYIPIFKRMKDIGTKLSFNVLCFFFPQLYFANRRMWGWSIATAVLMTILSIPAAISYFVKTGMEDSTLALFSVRTMEALYANRTIIKNLIEICNFAELALRILMCIFGNWLYFRFAVNTLKRMKKRSGGNITKERAAAFGGIRPLNMILALLLMLAITFATLIFTIIAIETFSFMTMQ